MSAAAEKAPDGFGRLFAAWERAAAEAASAVARDPRTLALGAGMLRAGLLATRSAQLAWEAACAPWRAALADRQS